MLEPSMREKEKLCKGRWDGVNGNTKMSSCECDGRTELVSIRIGWTAESAPGLDRPRTLVCTFGLHSNAPSVSGQWNIIWLHWT